MKSLLIDDVRTVEFIEATYGAKPTNVARTFSDGIAALKSDGPFDILFLDHDLACFDFEGTELTGYTVMLFLEENPELLPGKIVIVSSNPVGRQKMNVVIEKLYSGDGK